MDKNFFEDLDKELVEVSEGKIMPSQNTVKQFTEQKIINSDSNINESSENSKDEETNSWEFWSFFNKSIKETLMSNFPQTKFYLPKLRDWYTRVVPIGGHNEVGKNMSMYQYWEEILLIDAWIQFPEADMLWAKYSIPDISFLLQYKDKIKGLIITHGHLDHIGWLKHILPALWMPPLYATKLTMWFIKKSLEEHNLLSTAVLIEIDQYKEEKITLWKNFKVEFFPQNHSIPDATWVYLETPTLKLVHTWDFKIDFTPSVDRPTNLSRLAKIGDRWIDLLFSDSTNATKKWFTKSEKEIGDSIKMLVWQETNGRTIIATFSSLIWRIQQIVEACETNDKFVFLSGRSMVENVKIARNLNFMKFKPGTIKKLAPKSTEWIPYNRQLIITTWSQGEEFSALYRMAEWTHPTLKVIPWDRIILSSSPIPGNEKSVVDVINKLIKQWATVITNSDFDIHASGHAAQEEQKIMLNLMRPKNFIPIHWELFMRLAHKKTAIDMGVLEENIALTDNWDIIDIAPGARLFKSSIKVPVQEIIIDWHWVWVAWSHVIKARERMKNSWVLVIIYKIDAKTKAILWNIRIETRWLAYMYEVKTIHKLVIKKAKSVFENTIKDVPEIDEKDLLKILKDDLDAFILRKIDRSPMIIPIVVEI